MNAFRETLRGIAERVEGAQAVAIVGLDGIPAEIFSVGETVSMETVATEMPGLVKAGRNPRADVVSGPIREFAVVGDRCRILLSRVSPEYYLLLLLGGQAGLAAAGTS
jgi:predicted regulator of Ras-like GTPase activity (Roadblock/LC7/MglB family)